MRKLSPRVSQKHEYYKIIFKRIKPTKICLGLSSRSYSNGAAKSEQQSPQNASNNESTANTSDPIPSNSRFVYPEFLPDPEFKFRHPIREKLERQDMLARR